MKGYLFPFEMVEKGSRIVIYGYGLIGYHYLLQLTKTRYCDILYFVDQKYASMQEETRCRIVSAETLYKEPVSNYDYVIIAVGGNNVSDEIRVMLQSNGVPAEKIIVTGNRYLYLKEWCDAEEITERQIMEEETALSNYVARRYDVMDKRRRYNAAEYLPDLDIIIDSAEDKTRLLGALKMGIDKMKDDRHRLVLLHLMYLQGCFDRDCLKMLMHAIWGLDEEPSTQMAFFEEIDVIRFKRPELLYDTYFRERRILMQRIAERCSAEDIKQENQRNGDAFRVAITCYRFLNEAGLPTLVRKTALDLNEQGVEVSIFCLNSFFQNDVENVFLEPEYNPRPYTRIADDQEMICNGVEIVHFWQRDIYARMQTYTDAVMNYMPDTIVDLSDEFCPPIFLLHKYFPVIYIPARLEGSCSFFDVYLTQNKEISVKRNKIYCTIPEESIVEIKSPGLPVKRKEETCFKRAEQGVNEDDFILVTVGSRLENDINDELIKAMVEMLRLEPNMVWILVGDGNSIEKKLLRPYTQWMEQRRIILWGFERQLDSFYQMCDVYLQPMRTGGGMSVRQAMREGLPVAMLDYPGDVRYWVSDEDVVHGDYGDLMEYIRKLYHDHGFYQERSARMKQIIEECTCENEGERLLVICKAAAEKYGPLKQGRG